MFGIALIDSDPFRITCDVTLRRGTGEIILLGPVEPSIEETINHGISFAARIAELEEKRFPNLSHHNLLIRIRLPEYDAPIIGPSYGLLLCLELIFALSRATPLGKAAVIGEVTGDGDVLNVGACKTKCRAAAEFGADRIILPAGQLDFFNTEIVQIPVMNIFEAYARMMYGQTER